MLLSISVCQFIWWVHTQHKRDDQNKYNKKSTHTIWCWWGFNRQQYSDYQSYLNTLRAIKYIQERETEKNAPNCYFHIQCGSKKMNMYGVENEAINEVNNSDNSRIITAQKKINDQKPKFSSCKCILWLIHFDNWHATAKITHCTLTNCKEVVFCI